MDDLGEDDVLTEVAVKRVLSPPLDDQLRALEAAAAERGLSLADLQAAMAQGILDRMRADLDARLVVPRPSLLMTRRWWRRWTP